MTHAIQTWSAERRFQHRARADELLHAAVEQMRVHQCQVDAGQVGQTGSAPEVPVMMTGKTVTSKRSQHLG